ncbi:hypothetical protein D3C81_1971080 [compost metagenome]
MCDFFFTIPGQHQVVLRLRGGNVSLRLHQRVFVGGVVQFAQYLTGSNRITFVNRQRGQPTAYAKT